MLGDSELTINHATMVRALERYFAEEFVAAQRPTVLDVNVVYDSSGTNDPKTRRFLVKLQNPDQTHEQGAE